MKWKLQFLEKKGGEVSKAESVQLLIYFLRLVLTYLLFHNLLRLRQSQGSKER